MLKYILTSAIFLFATQSYGQDFIITNKLDTLAGKVKIVLGGKYYIDRVHVKSGKEKTNLPAFKVKTVFRKGEEYHGAKLDGRYQMVKVEKLGSFLSLYRFIDHEVSMTDYSGQVIITTSGATHKLANIGFKKRLLVFLDDCGDMKSKITNDYGKSDLYKILDDYNACMDGEVYLAEKKYEAVAEASKIDSLLEDIEKLDQKDKTELMDMLQDVKSKIESQETVPAYLSAAIKDKLAGNSELLEKFESLLNE